MLFGRHIGFMLIRNGHTWLIVIDNENLDIDTKLGFLSGMVPKLLDI